MESVPCLWVFLPQDFSCGFICLWNRFHVCGFILTPSHHYVNYFFTFFPQKYYKCEICIIFCVFIMYIYHYLLLLIFLFLKPLSNSYNFNIFSSSFTLDIQEMEKIVLILFLILLTSLFFFPQSSLLFFHTLGLFHALRVKQSYKMH